MTCLQHFYHKPKQSSAIFCCLVESQYSYRMLSDLEIVNKSV